MVDNWQERVMEINDMLQSMLQKTVQIQDMDISQQNKDMAKNIMNESLDMVIDQLSPRKINQITLQELRKNRKENFN